MKTFLLGLLGTIISGVAVTVVTDYVLPSLLPKPIHDVIHPDKPVSIPPPIAELQPMPKTELGRVDPLGSAHRATRSWCQAMKEQADFRKKHWGEVPQSLRTAFNEHGCPSWGIQMP